jgi:hypothetical protein
MRSNGGLVYPTIYGVRYLRVRPVLLRAARPVFLLSVLLGVARAEPPVKAFLDAEASKIDMLAPLTLGNYGLPRSPYLMELPAPDLRRLAASDFSSVELIYTLEDPSPRVRTLALELLFRKEDPHLLPYIFKLTADGGITFENWEYYDFSANAPTKKRRVAQTVGDFAKAMLNFYGVRGDFEPYWVARKDRKYWFTWLHSIAMFITGGDGTLNTGDAGRLAAIRQILDRLPPLDRDLYLIWLQCTFNRPAIADVAELSQAVKRLGRENVLAIAEGNPPSSDPDLQPAWDSHYYWVAGVVLDHATDILRPDDCDRLSAVVQRMRRRGGSDPFREGAKYTIAEARLRPEKASELLHAEIRHFSEPYLAGLRGQAAGALLQLAGKSELPFLREFFYGEPPDAAFYYPAQDAMIKSLTSQDLLRVEALLDDSRSASISPGLMARIYEQFPALQAKLLLDWFFVQKQDPKRAGNSIGYFLRIVSNHRDCGLMREILLDPRLPSLPALTLFTLQQELLGYQIPRAFLASFARTNEFAQYLNGSAQLSEQALPELLRFLRSAAEFVGPKSPL